MSALLLLGVGVQAQDRADFDICGKDGCGGVVCIQPDDSTYVVSVKIKQLPTTCTVSKYEVDWGDGKKETFTDLNVKERSHTYDLRSFVKNCSEDKRDFRIFVTPNCTNSDKGLTLTFNKKPRASIGVQGDVCEGEVIRLVNNSCPSSGDDVSWLWDLGNGQTSVLRSPTLPAASAANSPYTFALTATSKVCGSSKTQVTVPVRKKPVASFTATGYTVVKQDTVLCLAQGGVLTADGTASQDATRYRWSVTGGPATYVNNTGSGSAKPQIKFGQAGEYTLTLVVENDCGRSNPVVRKYKVLDEKALQLPRLDFVCEQPYRYRVPNPLAGATYTLNGQAFDPAAGVDIPYSDTPNIVEARLESPCGLQVARDTFTVGAPQTVYILDSDTTICIGGPPITLRANAAGGRWSGQNIDPQTGQFTPRSVGSFALTYTRGSGACLATDVTTVAVASVDIDAPPVATCAGSKAVKLTASPAGGTWSTPDCNGCIRGDSLFLAGVTARRLNLTYQYTSEIGCKASAQTTVSIGQPKAAFSIRGGCQGAGATVTNSSQGASEYRWYIDGQLRFTAQNPDLSGLPAGKSQIKLVAGTGACLDSTTQEVVIASAPDALAFDLQAVGDCSPLRVAFRPGGTPRGDVTYSWDFGDSAFAGFQPAERTFTNNGRAAREFTIRFSAKNECGTEIATKILTVKPLAKSEIGVDSTLLRCSPGRVKFSNRSSGHEASRSIWIFGDGTPPVPSASDTLVREFTATDSTRTYRVRLVVFSACGTDTSEVRIRVVPNTIKPLFTLSQTEACPGELIQFTDATTPKPERLVWKFGKEDIVTTANPKYAFKQPNTTYTVTLVAYTSCGYDSIQRTIRTTELPKAAFDLSAPVTCAGQEIRLTNKSDPANRFLWDFGDGNRDSTQFNPTHIFQEKNDKIVTLSVFGATKSCKSEVKKTVSVRPVVKADFRVEIGSSVCAPGPVQLRSLAQNATRYRWEFSDGQVSTVEHPAMSFRPGRYDVRFRASYENICADSTQQSGVIVVDSCGIIIPEAFTPNGDGQGDKYTVFGNGVESVESLRIRKRSGEVLFEAKDVPIGSQNPEESWDGTYRNVLMPNDMYVVEVLVKYSDGKRQNYVRNIYLIR